MNSLISVANWSDSVLLFRFSYLQSDGQTVHTSSQIFKITLLIIRKLLTHKRNEKAIVSSTSLTSLINQHDAVVRGEILIAMFIAEHHIAIRAVDHLTELIKVICNDSKLASKMKCHRTKATALIQVIASDIQSLLINKIRNCFFSSFERHSRTIRHSC